MWVFLELFHHDFENLCQYVGKGVKLEMHHKESVQIKTVYWLIFKK